MTQSLTANWLSNSLICVTLYGFWGFLSKLALLRGLSAAQEASIQKLGFFMLMPLIMKPSSNEPTAAAPLLSRPKTALLSAWLSGACCAIASMFYSRAMAHGDAGAVSAVTASYPPITLLLGALFAGEELSKSKIGGSILPLLGAYLFTRR